MNNFPLLILYIILILLCLSQLWISLKSYSKHKTKVITSSKSTITYSYKISVGEAENLINLYLSDSYDLNLVDSFSFYILTLLGKHEYESLRCEYLKSVVIKVQLDTGVVLKELDWKSYKIRKCFNKGKPTAYAFDTDSDCMFIEEYKSLYDYYIKVKASPTLPEHWSNCSLCLFVNFLASSRFAGNFNHDVADFVNVSLLQNDFLFYYDKLGDKPKENEFYIPSYCFEEGSSQKVLGVLAHKYRIKLRSNKCRTISKPCKRKSDNVTNLCAASMTPRKGYYR